MNNTKNDTMNEFTPKMGTIANPQHLNFPVPMVTNFCCGLQCVVLIFTACLCCTFNTGLGDELGQRCSSISDPKVKATASLWSCR